MESDKVAAGACVLLSLHGQLCCNNLRLCLLVVAAVAVVAAAAAAAAELMPRIIRAPERPIVQLCKRATKAVSLAIGHVLDQVHVCACCSLRIHSIPVHEYIHFTFNACLIGPSPALTLHLHMYLLTFSLLLR